MLYIHTGKQINSQKRQTDKQKNRQIDKEKKQTNGQIDKETNVRLEQRKNWQKDKLINRQRINRHPDIQTKMQTDRYTDRQVDRQASRQTDKMKESQRNRNINIRVSDPDFSTNLDPDPGPYSERPGSRSNIIAPKSYLSNKTSKILILFLGRIRIPIRAFLVDPDPDPYF